MTVSPSADTGDAQQGEWVIEGSTDADVEWLSSQLAASRVAEDSEHWQDPSPSGVLTKLFDALEEASFEEVRELLKQLEPGCSIDTVGPEGDTLLHLACLYDSFECAELLLAHGASPVIRDEDDSTCLHDACASGALEIVELLLEKAPELITAVDCDGDTPLHNAARGGFLAIAELLLDAGADVTARNGNGQTPLALCGDDCEPALPELLEAAEARGDAKPDAAGENETDAPGEAAAAASEPAVDRAGDAPAVPADV